MTVRFRSKSTAERVAPRAALLALIAALAGAGPMLAQSTTSTPAPQAGAKTADAKPADAKTSASQSTKIPPPPPEQQWSIQAGLKVPADYVIGADDVLTVVFWRDKDMSGDVVVRPDGKITLPLLNDIQAAGLTPDQLREQVSKLAEHFLEEPAATVVVKQINSRKVFITGEVSKPGPYPLTTPTTVLQLIAMAGGLGEYAHKDEIVIMRSEGGKS